MTSARACPAWCGRGTIPLEVGEPPTAAPDPEAGASPYQAGSRRDFDRLYATTYDRVFRTVLALLGNRAAAEDCAQEAYLRAYRSWARWRPDAPAEAWIHRIAINVAVSHRRRERLAGVRYLLLRAEATRYSDPIEGIASQDLLRELRALPPKQAAALVLRHLHGYTNREIALALGVPEQTIASRLAAARARLQVRLRDHQKTVGPSGLSVLGDE